jgi:HAD superfamily hydrolase (TIGR01509 family)
MDGLLVDSEPIWTVAERELFATWGVAFTPPMKSAIVGMRMDTAVPVMIELGAPGSAGATVEEVSTWLLRRMAALFARDLPLLPGVLDLLSAAHRAGIPQALVSSSYRVLVDAVLAGVPDRPFTVAVAGDEVTHGKPDPESYLLAAHRLGVDPRQCVVLEDTPTGARAGAAAGATVVFCPSVEGAGEAEASWQQVPSLARVSLTDLSGWMPAPRV